MPWVKLDDRFPDHPKIAQAGPLAGWLYICGLAYANRMSTDGHLPAGIIRRLADLDNAAELADRLVSAGLWERADGGYTIHDYHDYQPTREHVEHVSRARADAGQRGGKQKASNLLARGQLATLAKSYPVPVPLLTDTSDEVSVQPAPVENVENSIPAIPKPRQKEVGWIERHPLWQTVVELFGRPAPSQMSSVAQSLKDLDALGATPDELRKRHGNYPAVMGTAADGTPILLTLRALVKHWSACEQRPAPMVNGAHAAQASPASGAQRWAERHGLVRAPP